MASRILLVDDDPKIIALLRRGLAYEGFEVYTAMDGDAGLAAAQKYQPHIVLLDITMPGQDGFELCRRLRLHGDMAIIMLTARDDVEDKVNALNLGADDYVPKPFAFDELVARIRAVLRRHNVSGELLTYADLEINQTAREVQRAGHPIELTTLEYELLVLFMHHPRQVLTRDQILERVWGYNDETETNVLEVHIGHLRQKLEAYGSPRLIQTIRGIGYALRG
ncbi:MAG TPA: response regulator transcription factor [Ktedonobacteraceae bacterium]